MTDFVGRKDQVAARNPLVLLVEDHDASALVTGIFLEHFGYCCVVARDGREAIEKFQQESYAAVLMDIQMPGIGGYEATRMIRAYEAERKSPRTPVIGLTARALIGDRQLCLEAGMDDYLSKPFSEKALRAMLEKHCG